MRQHKDAKHNRFFCDKSWCFNFTQNWWCKVTNYTRMSSPNIAQQMASQDSIPRTMLHM